MPEGLLQILNQIRDIWNNLPRQAQIVVPIVGLVILGALIGFSLWSGTEEDVVIFSGLSDRDLKMVQTELANSGIKYTLPTSGTVSVPNSEIARAQMVLAMAGIPRSTSGYQVFEQSSGFGDTFLDYNRKDQQKTEINIRNAIETLDPVQYATVQITPMVDSAFAVDKQPAKAVVIVTLKSSRTLDYQQIEGMTNIVALSVKGLSKENVQIIDEQGRTLSGEDVQTSYDMKMEGAFRKLQYEDQISTQRAERIRQSLAPLVGGLEHVKANVVVETNFDDQTTNEVLYNPSEIEIDSIPLQMETTIVENTTGPSGLNSAVAGATANINSETSVNSSSDPPITVGKNSKETQYLVSERTTTKRTSPGSITRLTATVLIDYQLTPDGTRQAWETNQITQLTSYAQNAVGFQSDRGDSVELISIEFDTFSKQQREAELSNRRRSEMYQEIAKYITIGAIALVVLFLMRSSLEQLQLSGSPSTSMATSTADIEGDLSLGVVPNLSNDTGLAALSSNTGGISLTESIGTLPQTTGAEAQEIGRLQSEVMTLADQKPEAIAQIIESWLSEPEEMEVEEAT
ncbi:MAG: flagellar basal-body MS-ring/collar protein FliF [Candidatus Poribacteria bacterium]|nr:flagellar basal-body MS-ring/collar protein FliF [Candidatus Poribacteria bacterium]